ncbi:MAG: hypothetical protein ACTTKL_08685 [Treponema sp.]
MKSGFQVRNVKNIAAIYGLLFLGLICVGALTEVFFFGEPLSLLLQEHYFLYVLIGGALAAADWFGGGLCFCSAGGILTEIVLLALIAGTPASVFLSVKKRKLFPFIVIFILCSCVYIFVGMIAFGIRDGEV